MERTILDVISRLHGRTLVLFTSRAHLRATYQALREPLPGAAHHAAGAGDRRELAHAAAATRFGAARGWRCSAPTRSGRASTSSATR